MSLNPLMILNMHKAFIWTSCGNVVVRKIMNANNM